MQIRHGAFLLLPLILAIFPYLHLHQIPIFNSIIPTPPPSTNNVPLSAAAQAQSQYQIQGLNVQQMPLSQLTSTTMHTLNHLVPTIHLIKYSHAAIMRSQNNGESSPTKQKKKNQEIIFLNPISESTTASTSSPHSRATQWWAEEAREGSIVRNDENVRKIMRSAGWSFDEAVIEAEGKKNQEEGTLLTNAKKAVEKLKEQGGVKSDHWVF